MGGAEASLVAEAFASNWIAPLGPQVDAFEAEFATRVGSAHALALSSGTAALHLGLKVLGVGPGDDVLVSTLTFAASAFPIRYVGANPVFVDAELGSWNLDASLVASEVGRRARRGRLPKAVIAVHLYGQSADLDPMLEVCAEHGIPLLEDAAESLGGSYKGRSPGTLGRLGAFSFNGNKIITTSGGGMLVSDDGDALAHARKLATQARDAAPHYEHSELGYNYRLSNILAAIGRGQLRVLDERVEVRRQIFNRYLAGLGNLPGVTFMPESPWGRHNRWLTTLTIDPVAFGATSESVRVALERQNIEARPVWKPMHLQPVFRGCEVVGGTVAERIFENGLCLPSGSSLTPEDQDRVIAVVRDVHEGPRVRRGPPNGGPTR